MASLMASLTGSPRLTRWGGFAALLGGALAAALTLSPRTTSTAWPPPHPASNCASS